MQKLLLLIIAVLLGGCATPVNPWVNRVGEYTYRQAIIERGTADTVEKFDDGTTVAVWVIRKHRNWQDRLILVFDKKGKLVSGEEKRF